MCANAYIGTRIYIHTYTHRQTYKYTRAGVHAWIRILARVFDECWRHRRRREEKASDFKARDYYCSRPVDRRRLKVVCRRQRDDPRLTQDARYGTRIFPRRLHLPSIRKPCVPGRQASRHARTHTRVHSRHTERRTQHTYAYLCTAYIRYLGLRLYLYVYSSFMEKVSYTQSSTRLVSQSYSRTFDY